MCLEENLCGKGVLSCPQVPFHVILLIPRPEFYPLVVVEVEGAKEFLPVILIYGGKDELKVIVDLIDAARYILR